MEEDDDSSRDDLIQAEMAAFLREQGDRITPPAEFLLSDEMLVPGRSIESERIRMLERAQTSRDEQNVPVRPASPMDTSSSSSSTLPSSSSSSSTSLPTATTGVIVDQSPAVSVATQVRQRSIGSQMMDIILQGSELRAARASTQARSQPTPRIPTNTLDPEIPEVRIPGTFPPGTFSQRPQPPTPRPTLAMRRPPSRMTTGRANPYVFVTAGQLSRRSNRDVASPATDPPVELLASSQLYSPGSGGQGQSSHQGIPAAASHLAGSSSSSSGAGGSTSFSAYNNPNPLTSTRARPDFTVNLSSLFDPNSRSTRYVQQDELFASATQLLTNMQSASSRLVEPGVGRRGEEGRIENGRVIPIRDRGSPSPSPSPRAVIAPVEDIRPPSRPPTRRPPPVTPPAPPVSRASPIRFPTPPPLNLLYPQPPPPQQSSTTDAPPTRVVSMAEWFAAAVAAEPLGTERPGGRLTVREWNNQNQQPRNPNPARNVTRVVRFHELLGPSSSRTFVPTTTPVSTPSTATTATNPTFSSESVFAPGPPAFQSVTRTFAVTRRNSRPNDDFFEAGGNRELSIVSHPSHSYISVTTSTSTSTTGNPEDLLGGPPTKPVESVAIKRLRKEAEHIRKFAPEGCSAAPKEEDLFEWSAVIEGPVDTVYEGGTFFVEFTFPDDYPNKPPKVTFLTRIYHCNINTDGTVLPDVLRDTWTSEMGVDTVLDAILHMMNNHETFDALVKPIAQQYREKREEFDRCARIWTERYAT